MKVAHLAALCSVIGLTACQSTPNPNKQEMQMQDIYHAPAQIFDFDLSSSVLRGGLELKQSCDVTGTSLDIRDQLNQQVRIDTFNLKNNSQFNATDDLKNVAKTVLEKYQSKYHLDSTGTPKLYKTDLGDVVITQLQQKDHQMNLAIVNRYNFAYVVLLNSPILQKNMEESQKSIKLLLKSLSIPGAKLKNSESDLPISFDLSNTNPQARSSWQKTYCS